MGNDSAWVAGSTWSVPVVSTEVTNQVCTGGAVTPEIVTKIEQYLASRALTVGEEPEETPVMQIQQRVHVHFEKAMTAEQAQNYKTRIVLASMSNFPEFNVPAVE